MASLVDGKSWKTALNSLPEEIVKTDNVRVSEMVDLILGAKLKQTMREKRKAQMASRKYLVRAIFQVFGKSNIYFLTLHITPGLNLNLDKSQCTGTIDSANNAVLSADFKNVIFKMIHWA